MKTIKRLLEADTRVDGYRVTETATESCELFFVHKKLETVRATDTVETAVTVYVDHDGAKGDSTFAVYRSMGEEEIARKIGDAVSRARLVKNEPYELPAAETLDAALPTNMADEDMRGLAARIADAVFAADTLPGGSINACEIFLYRDTKRVINSRGLDKTQRSCRVMIEAIPTFTTEAGSVELYEDYRFTEFEPARVTAEIARRLEEARDRAGAARPETPLTIDVALRPEEISSLAEELADSLGYGTVYMQANPFKLGDDLQEGGDGDRLTVTMKAIVPGSDESAFFDADGSALHDTCVIERGVVKAYYGSSRYGQYLGVEVPSGVLPCVEVAPGTLTEAELTGADYIECASLSGLQVDIYSDYIGGEIRLAYLHRGGKVTPITGITMSAKLSEVLRGLRLSEKTVTDGAYEGPALLLMKSVAVL